MKIRIVMVGRLGSGAADRLTADYLRRLRRFCTVELVSVRGATGKAVRGARRAERETRACLEEVAPRETIAALDPAGDLLTSDAFARWLGRSLDAGDPVTFLVGGAEGLTEAVRGRADRLLSLSPLTLPHEMARAVLAEQLYRAFSILRGTPYAR